MSMILINGLLIIQIERGLMGKAIVVSSILFIIDLIITIILGLYNILPIVIIGGISIVSTFWWIGLLNCDLYFDFDMSWIIDLYKRSTIFISIVSFIMFIVFYILWLFIEPSIRGFVENIIR